jgi:hypothetical protein
MKSIRSITLSALLTIGAFGAVTYTACNKDECNGVICENNGTCISGSCSCPAGYEGTRCEKKSSAKFVGSWGVSEICDGISASYQVTITSDPTNPARVFINNLGNYGCDIGGTITNITYNGSVTSTTLSINETKCGYDMDATGTYDNGIITITYSATYDDGTGVQTDNCTAVLEK